MKFPGFNNERGLALVEVLVAFVVLSMLLVLITNSLILGVRQNAGSYYYNAAMALAQSKMEEIKGKPFNSVVNVTSADFSAETDYSQFAGFWYELTVESGGLNNKKVTVTVSYCDEGMAKTFALTSGITKR
ncbi:MAG: prepilin-type N-terminal cleavage/methylation domain-containing protein [Desulfotomaculaceae bacterium]|nr:prepilin-type N-terminal cleavage/methylation domain-containing protein [Desulfotomaculaceae bacterium]